MSDVSSLLDKLLSPRTSLTDIWGTQEADGPCLVEAKQKLLLLGS